MPFEDVVGAAHDRLDDFRALRDAGLIHKTGTFFPAGIHYPPITAYPPMNGKQFLQGWRDPADGQYVFYLHVPFCKRQCTFCHYPIVTGTGDDTQDEVISLLGKEMDLWLNALGLSKIRARSVLLGGGTPTHLSPRLFRKLHDEIAKRVDLGTCAQLTYDVHPSDLVDDAGRERLQIMRDFGSDRLTLGLQEMDEAILKHMNRPPTVVLAAEAMEACRKAGFTDLNIEFIFGYPGQTLEGWYDTVEKGLDLDPEEIQFYRLKIQHYGQGEGPVEALYQRQPGKFTANETQILMKQMAILQVNARGYDENLVRVFTKKPEFTSHYTTDQCCKLQDTVGVGPSAFSSFRDRFCINEPDVGKWSAGVLAGELPVFEGVIRDRDQQLRWNLVLPLKNSEVYKDFYEERTGERAEVVFAREFDELKRWDLLREDETQIRLTTKGKFFADEICQQLGHPEYLPHADDGYADGPLKLSRALDATNSAVSAK